MELTKSGYIYILINPSMEGLIKIGKTKREPSERIRELSGPTGVPTPFILVYKEFFDDCDFAEILIHEMLEERQERISGKREFFTTPVYEAISFIQSIKQDNLYSSQDERVSNDNILISANNTLAEHYYREGLNFYYGDKDNLQDYKKAKNHFLKAGGLGNADAYYMLGYMHVFEQGVAFNIEKSLEYYQKGAELGNNYCFGEMALCYSLITKAISHENAKKCWKKYFEKLEYSELSNTDYRFLKEYIYFIHSNNYSSDFTNILKQQKQEILKIASEELSYGCDSAVELYLNEIITYLNTAV